MSLERTKIFLSIIINLTVYQYTRSQYTQYIEYVHNKPQNSTYSDNANNSYIIDVASIHDTRENMDNYDNMGTSDVWETKIAGGIDAKLGAFPYMVVVHQLMGNGLIGKCGGTIISNRWVLTAGHCAVHHPRKFLVVFGIIDKSGIGYDFIRGPGISMITTQAFVHPQYAESHNDIALLYMPNNIPFSNIIKPIRLADQYENFANKEAFVIGWGKEDMASKGTSRLKYASLPIMENNNCRQYWRISSQHICTAPGLGRDACQGDSGGPLVVVKNGQDLQVGIVSYGDAFCPSNSPGVFTRVSSFIDWIRDITKVIGKELID